MAPEVVDKQQDVKVNEKSIEEYDSVYAEIPVKNATFGRVMLEIMEEKGVKTNYSSTAFFTMAKKNYLYYVLHEKGVPCPKTVVIASEKSARNIEKLIPTPVIARKMEELRETEKDILESSEEIEKFVEGVEYEEDLIIFQENSEGDKYKCLVLGNEVISLKDGSEGWKFDKNSLKYANPSDKKIKTVKKASKVIGTPIAEVTLRGNKVYDVNPEPELELYSELAGKDVYKKIAEILKEDK